MAYHETINYGRMTISVREDNDEYVYLLTDEKTGLHPSAGVYWSKEEAWKHAIESKNNYLEWNSSVVSSKTNEKFELICDEHKAKLEGEK